jgi:hypothetical protein
MENEVSWVQMFGECHGENIKNVKQGCFGMLDASSCNALPSIAF